MADTQTQGAPAQQPAQTEEADSAQKDATALQKPKPKRRVLTSLALQVFVFFGAWWDLFWFVLEILVFIWKGWTLPYPSRNFGFEFAFCWIFPLVEVPRLFLMSMGNKTERAAPLFYSYVLALPLIGLYIYFLQFQTYALKIELLINAIALAFIGIQLLFAFWTTFLFIRASRFT